MKRSLSIALCANLLIATTVEGARRLPVPPKPRAADALKYASGDGLWSPVESKMSEEDPSDISVEDGHYGVYSLEPSALADLLARAPMEGSDAAKREFVEMSIPMPDGTFGRFQIEESPIMEPEFQAQFPEIRTYAGTGIDDPTASLRFDATPSGFHAMIVSSERTVYVDPYRLDDTSRYVCYDKRGVRGGLAACSTEGVDELEAEAADAAEKGAGVASANGDRIRYYRLALAATYEYTKFFGGTKQKAIAAMTTTVNRVNLVFKREFSISFLFNPHMDLIFATSNDPYTNGDATKMSEENQPKVDAVVGSANYEVGHVFGTAADGGDGRGKLPSACQNGIKAKGASCYKTPVGYIFDSGYVPHELAHQFNATHTYNATSCGTLTTASTYERGSGTTIMSYAGICADADNVESVNDEYFHTANLEQVITYTTTGLGKSAHNTVLTLNGAPAVDAGATYTVPRNTPFSLTATGGDPNPQDALTFCWEQYDKGTTATTKPLFRSLPPSSARNRFFPNAGALFAYVQDPWETLPDIARNMNFRCTARDGKGGVAWDSTVVKVAGSPFLLTSPAEGVVWAAGSVQTVTWTVESPKIATSVDILFFDGANYTSLKGATPNDGVEQIVVPNKITSEARILVRAAGNNIFFSLNPGDFFVASGNVSIPVDEGFEGSYPGWGTYTASGSAWYVDTKAPHSGLRRFTVGGGSYQNNTESYLVSPYFSVTGKTKVVLTYYVKHKTEQGYDFVTVYAQPEGGTESYLYDSRSGTSVSWDGWAPKVTVDLTAVVAKANGKPVRLFFGFSSDASEGGWGAAVDDIRVTAQ